MCMSNSNREDTEKLLDVHCMKYCWTHDSPHCISCFYCSVTTIHRVDHLVTVGGSPWEKKACFLNRPFLDTGVSRILPAVASAGNSLYCLPNHSGEEWNPSLLYAPQWLLDLLIVASTLTNRTFSFECHKTIHTKKKGSHSYIFVLTTQNCPGLGEKRTKNNNTTSHFHSGHSVGGI